MHPAKFKEAIEPQRERSFIVADRGQINGFIETVARGPFKCLRGYDGNSSRRYVEKCNPYLGDIFACAVYQAYLDMCRTVPGAGKGERKKEIEKTRNIVAEKLRDYFAGESKTKREGFDKWYESALSDMKEAPARLSVGQAQKLFNMAFKYLYCCEDFRVEYGPYFICCHMPLDGYTLGWSKRECASNYDGKAWSAIDDVAKYRHIVAETREKLKDKVVLEEEFSIWAAEKARIERDNVRKAALKVAAHDGCPEGLKEQLESYAELLAKQFEE